MLVLATLWPHPRPRDLAGHKLSSQDSAPAQMPPQALGMAQTCGMDPAARFPRLPCALA